MQTRYQLFINNAWVDPTHGEWFDSLDPFTGEPWAQIPRGTRDDVDRAAQAASAAMKGPWSKLSPTNRGMLLYKLATLIEENLDLLTEVEARDNGKLRSEVRAIDGVREAVASVTTQRCICSNSRSERIEFMLEKVHLLPFFAGRIFSALEIPSKKTKPAPDVFLLAAEKLGANPANTFVIEDSVHGVTGARAAGMRVIGFTGASHSYPGHADALTEAGAETVIRRWAELKSVIAALSEWSADA